jgi:hypothetical protein
MILYHFTCAEFLKSIMRQGLCRGDVRTKQIGPLFETNAVWLTTDPQPKGHGLGLPGTLTKEDRMRHFMVFGTMPPQESRYQDKLWASSVGAFCFQLFVYRFSNPVAGHRQSRRLLRHDSTRAST